VGAQSITHRLARRGVIRTRADTQTEWRAPRGAAVPRPAHASYLSLRVCSVCQLVDPLAALELLPRRETPGPTVTSGACARARAQRARASRAHQARQVVAVPREARRSRSHEEVVFVGPSSASVRGKAFCPRTTILTGLAS